MTAPAPAGLPPLRLEGRRALVTGASSGIGLAAALAGAGARVTLAARDEDRLDEAARAIGAAATRAIDVTDLSSVKTWLEASEPFDVLVGAAGLARHASTLDVSEEEWDTTFGINLRAAFFVAQGVAARLVKAGKPGSIITVSSQMGHVGGQHRAAYTASKHGRLLEKRSVLAGSAVLHLPHREQRREAEP